MSAKVEEGGGGVAVGGNAASAGQNTIQCQCSHHECLRVVTVACVIVTSLAVCALAVNSIQRDIDIDKLQQQVADLQRTVATLHQLHQHRQQHQLQQQQRSSVNTSYQQDQLHTTQVSLAVTTVSANLVPCF